MENLNKTVVTHSGPFHADDVLAFLFLSLLGVVGRLVRTRDPGAIKAGDIVFDVGGSYDPATRRYDHHMKGGAGARENGVPYAACGLVWKHHGPELCAQYASRFGVPADALWQALDETVVQGVDAMDCGAVEGWDARVKGRPETRVTLQTLSGVVSVFNPASLVDGGSPGDFDTAFLAAADAVRPIWERLVVAEVSRLKAEAVVASCDRGEPVMVLDPFCPWQDTVLATMPHVMFVVFRNPEGTFMIQAVPAAAGSFDTRKSLPKDWAGLRDEALSAKTGVPDCVFCHPGCFIAGHKTLDGALKIAKLALDA